MSEKFGTILFVEDDRIDQMAFCRFAKESQFSYDFILAGSVAEALGKLAPPASYDVVVLDYLLGDGTAFDLLDELNDMPVILVTGTGDIEIAIKAMKKGVYDYLEKDPHGNYLRALTITIEKAILRKKDERELEEYRQNLEEMVAIQTAGLRGAVTKYKNAEAEIERALTMQQMINQLLQAALKPVSLREHLAVVLEKILALPWPNMAGRGAIFLIDDENPERLHLQTAIGAESRSDCICGKAAMEKKIQVADGDDDSNPHSQYCVPILSRDDKVLGVISLYFKKSHVTTALEKENFVLIARTLASIMEHFRANKRREELQEQLMQAQKMESIGRLAGGVAHDFNNILGAINGYAELILMKMAGDDNNPVKGYSEIILASGQRAASLTQQLLSFSRKEVVKPKVINLNNVLQEGNKILDRVIGDDIVVEYIPEPDLWDIKSDPTKINQIVMNLAVNAMDAMPDGGTLTFVTRNIIVDERDEFVQLKINDCGIGMSRELISQIFDPFFTTKEVSKGTGLGLSTVYGIVQQNGGSIKVESRVGEGSSFIINFPRTREKVMASGTDHSSSMQQGDETILLAEDNKPVRTLLSNILTSLGYKVLEAVDGSAALEIGCSHDCIDLLLTDVIMPVMGGHELYIKLIEKCPSIKVIFMSGFTGDSEAIQKVLDSGVEFLQKPISLDALGQTVRKVLDE